MAYSGMEAGKQGVLWNGQDEDLQGLDGLGVGGTGRAARQGGRPAAARLDSRGNKWNREVEIVTHRCKARTCRVCGRRRGWETRQVLLEPDRLGLFVVPAMLTFTVDPKKFDSAEQAHDTITKGGFLRRLLKLLKIRAWVWVLEFHKSGWPHWHVLVDLSERGRLTPEDLRRCWRLWRDKWGLGGVDVRLKRQFETAEHAVMYVTKYLMKPPKTGYPEWFLAGKGRRLVQASKRVGALCFKGSEHKETQKETEKRRESRSLAVRMAECGTSCRLILREVNTETGEERVECLGELPASRGELVERMQRGELPGVVGLVVQTVKFWGGQYQRVVLRGAALRLRVGVLGAWAAQAGLADKRRVKVAAVMKKLCGGNSFLDFYS